MFFSLVYFLVYYKYYKQQSNNNIIEYVKGNESPLRLREREKEKIINIEMEFNIKKDEEKNETEEFRRLSIFNKEPSLPSSKLNKNILDFDFNHKKNNKDVDKDFDINLFITFIYKCDFYIC